MTTTPHTATRNAPRRTNKGQVMLSDPTGTMFTTNYDLWRRWMRNVGK
jgi:hypothetical protein